MNRIFFVLSALLFSLYSANSQTSKTEKNHFVFSDFSKRIVEVQAPQNSKNMQAARVSVIDVRYDSLMIGLVDEDYLVLDDNSMGMVERYLNSSLKPATGQNIGNFVLFIKRFWVGHEVKLTQEKAIKKSIHGTWLPGFILDAHVFFQQENSLTPLFKMDTVITVDSYKLANGNLIRQGLEVIANKIAAINVTERVAKAKQYKWEEISQYYYKRLELPILVGQPKKGVYRNSKEFKENNPSIKDYEVRFEKEADMLYVQDSIGASELVRDVWGFCDGNNIYVKQADNYFPLTKIGRSFYLLGFKDVSVRILDAVGRPVVMDGAAMNPFQSNQGSKVVFHYFYKPYHVDMENGDIY